LIWRHSLQPRAAGGYIRRQSESFRRNARARGEQ
jgi:hypothetical protein